MAKNNQQSQNSNGVCEKLYNAIRGRAHSPYKTSIPAPTPPQAFPLSATAVHAPLLKEAARKLTTSGEVIPIEIDPHLLSTLQLSKPTNHQDSLKRTGQVQPQKKLMVQESMNDKFTAYITRVRRGMMRSSSNVGSAKISSRHDSFNDNVVVNDHSSEYIRRAHLQMKNSSVTGGKNVTFK